jgi:hypothetical protein
VLAIMVLAKVNMWGEASSVNSLQPVYVIDDSMTCEPPPPPPGVMSYPELFKIAMRCENLFIFVELDRREEKWVATDAHNSNFFVRGGLHINYLVFRPFFSCCD